MSEQEQKTTKSPSLTDKTIDAVTQLVRLGVPPLTAALSKGVSEEDFCKWMEKGAQSGKGNWRYEKFYVAVNRAEAEAEAILIGRIRSAAQDNWSAASWLIERRFPEAYTKRSVNSKEQDLELPDGDPFAELDAMVPQTDKAKKKKR